MQSQKEQQSIRRKLGSILGLGASRAIPSPQKSYEELGKLEHTAFITQDVLRVRVSGGEQPHHVMLSVPGAGQCVASGSQSEGDEGAA